MCRMTTTEKRSTMSQTYVVTYRAVPLCGITSGLHWNVSDAHGVLYGGLTKRQAQKIARELNSR